MVLSNKERQARYRARLKELAATAAGLSDATAELLVRHRGMIADLDQQIAMLESGAIRFLRGSEDASEEALERAREQRTRLQEVVEKHDPAGLTALDHPDFGSSHEEA